MARNCEQRQRIQVGGKATARLRSFARRQWDLKQGNRFLHLPFTAFWPGDTFARLLDFLHLMHIKEALCLHLGGKTRPGEAQNTQTVGWDEQLIN